MKDKRPGCFRSVGDQITTPRPGKCCQGMSNIKMDMPDNKLGHTMQTNNKQPRSFALLHVRKMLPQRSKPDEDKQIKKRQRKRGGGGEATTV